MYAPILSAPFQLTRFTGYFHALSLLGFMFYAWNLLKAYELLFDRRRRDSQVTMVEEGTFLFAENEPNENLKHH